MTEDDRELRELLNSLATKDDMGHWFCFVAIAVLLSGLAMLLIVLCGSRMGGIF